MEGKVIKAYPGITIRGLLVNVQKPMANDKLQEYLMKTAHVILFVGSNDISDQRHSYPIPTLVHHMNLLVNELRTYSNIRNISIIRPPPKKNFLLSERIGLMWDAIEGNFRNDSSVQLHEANWQLNMVGSDGVHLTPKARQHLYKYISNIRKPVSRGQFGITISPKIVEMPEVKRAVKRKLHELTPSTQTWKKRGMATDLVNTSSNKKDIKGYQYSAKVWCTG